MRYNALARRYSLVLLFVLALLSLVALSAFIPNAANAKITWSPGTVDQTIAPGTIYTTNVAFASSESFTNATLSLTPSLQDVLVITPPVCDDHGGYFLHCPSDCDDSRE